MNVRTIGEFAVGLLLALEPWVSAATPWKCRRGDFELTWDLEADRAALAQVSSGRNVWQGPLLPGFWLQSPSGEKLFVKAAVDATASEVSAVGGTLQLSLAKLGRGTLRFSAEPSGVRFQELRIEWETSPPAIIGLYFGSSALTDEQRTVVPSLELPFWPGWSAEGYSVPSGKGGPVQSFFRNWDLGHATFPLGSFGPSLGTPYAAAFPRPVLSAAMGGRNGWLAFGPGSIPDAALTFDIRATAGTLHYLYREDLWGERAGATRIWSEPLRLAWGPTAWDAFRELYATFGSAKAANPIHQQSHWSTWGNFKIKHYDLRFEADRAAAFGAEILQLDDGWETSTGSGMPNLQRFPNFVEDFQYIRSKGLKLGFWLVGGWVNDLAAAGIGPEDLLLGKDGRPRRANWNMAADAAATSNYCLDPSSSRARAFLRQRTIRMMREYHPQLLKLDFGYGLPGPDVSAARDPEFRGERLAYELIRIIAEAAREINPEVTIQYYGIHPLMRPITDLIALDDLGDGGGYEVEAHSQWSLWSALAAGRGSAIMSSSGYDWKGDSEILLDTAVIGAPGSVLPLPQQGQAALPESWVAHRQALSRWYRRTTGWEPLWLNSERGAIGHEPEMRCFGRVERIGGIEQLTSVALRRQKPEDSAAEPLRGMRWDGRWAIISQDDRSIFASRKLACIPFDGGYVEIPMDAAPDRVLAVRAGSEKKVDGWSFEAGKLRLEVPAGSDSVLGFLIVRDR